MAADTLMAMLCGGSLAAVTMGGMCIGAMETVARDTGTADTGTSWLAVFETETGTAVARSAGLPVCPATVTVFTAAMICCPGAWHETGTSC